MTTNDVQALHDMLTGKSLPDGVTIERLPNLPDDVAFSVIWYLQEIMRIIPDNYEMCAQCHAIFDEHEGGTCVPEGAFDDSEWYTDCGFTKEEVERCAGLSFCSPECEIGYMRELI
jgi:hypothetical protein